MGQFLWCMDAVEERHEKLFLLTAKSYKTYLYKKILKYWTEICRKYEAARHVCFTMSYFKDVFHSFMQML